MSRKKGIWFVPLGAIAFLLALASLAFACTSVHGYAEITEITHNSSASNSQCPAEPTTGWKCAAPGDTIKVKAHGGPSGTDPPHRYAGGSALIDYYLYLLPHGEDTDDNMISPTCMPGAGAAEMGSTSVPMMQLTDDPVHATGGASSVIPETTATVPYLSGTHLLGPAWVCFMGGGWVDGQDVVTDATNKAASRFLAMNATYPDTLDIVLI